MLNLTSYFLINLFLLFGYIGLKILSACCATVFSQQQWLKLTRHNFAAIMLCFLLIPIIAPQQKVLMQPSTLDSSNDYLSLIFMTLLFGTMIHLLNYLYSLYQLKKLPNSLLLVKKTKRIAIYFSDEATTSFCYTLFYRHYVILPTCVTDFKLSLKHELQHIRNRDTHWLHCFNFLKIFFFWNPAFHLWLRWCMQLQEYACDEVLVNKHTHLLPAYAQCLLDTAKLQARKSVNVLSINNGTKKLLTRRIQMLFDYKPIKKSLLKTAMHLLSLLTIASSAYATQPPRLTQANVNALVQSYGATLDITAEPEVVNKLNQYLTDPIKKTALTQALQRFKKYQTQISTQLKVKQVPLDFMAMPLVQSGYQPLDASKNKMHAAGLWQIIPSTAKRLGLVVNTQTDERLNTEKSTNAAANYLAFLYEKFQSWKLAALAYEIGEKHTEQLITATGSRNAWQIARSYRLEPGLKREVISYLANFDASVILMHHPELFTPSAS